MRQQGGWSVFSTHLALAAGAGVRLQDPRVSMAVGRAHVHTGARGAIAAPGLQQQRVGAGVGVDAAGAAVPRLLHGVLTGQLRAVHGPAVRLTMLLVQGHRS